MSQIQQVGESKLVMGKSLCAVGAQKVVFTQEAFFNNEKGRIEKLENYSGRGEQSELHFLSYIYLLTMKSKCLLVGIRQEGFAQGIKVL